jgi:hypothetical protein
LWRQHQRPLSGGGIEEVIRRILACESPDIPVRVAALASPGQFWDDPALACASKGLIAMRAIHLLTGCVFALGLVATAHAATNVDAGSAGAGDCAHSTTADGGSSRDATASGGESVGLAHTTAPATQGSNSTSSRGDSTISGSGGSDDAAPAQSHRVSLGWQSLLPGSIQ